MVTAKDAQWVAIVLIVLVVFSCVKPCNVKAPETLRGSIMFEDAYKEYDIVLIALVCCRGTPTVQILENHNTFYRRTYKFSRFSYMVRQMFKWNDTIIIYKSEKVKKL